MTTPSIKTLSRIFSDAKEAKRILNMGMEQLCAVPVNARWVLQCYHLPSVMELRMNALNELGGFYGVEGFETSKGKWITYLNAGDTYALTLVHFGDRYIVSTCGDIAEKYN